MRQSFISTGLLAVLVNNVAAFPTMIDDLAKEQKRQNDQDGGVPDLINYFDPKLQYVSNTGDHAFVAPDFEAGDVRGPCPGLNAMANHGYLPRNGVGSHLDFITGTETVFGMSVDLAGFLTLLGGALDGDGLTWSIGGPSKASSAIALGGLLGTPQGISGSHNKYENDVSPTRGDLYLVGNDFSLQMDQYQQLYDMGQAAGDDYSLALLEEYRSKRFDYSVQNNPYFFNGPFTGLLVQPAAFTFIYRFMANKSAEYPNGKLNGDVLNSFFSVTKDADGNLVHTPGHEKIPDNWYKRAIGDEYTIPTFNLDVVAGALKYPKYLDIGGNTGKVNTFTGVDVEDISKGVFNAKSLMEGNNLACFAMQFATQAAPDLVKCGSVLGSIADAVLGNLTSQMSKSLAGLSCPQLTSIDETQFSQFPGYSKVNCKTGSY